MSFFNGKDLFFWICFAVIFFTLYHGKSPSNHHLGVLFFTFSEHQTSKSMVVIATF